MAWNWLDITVVLLALAQIVLCVAIGMIAMRIRKGPVARMTTVIRRNVVSGKRLVDTGSDIATKSLPPLLRTRASLMRLTKAFRPVAFDDAPVTYSSLAKNLTSLSAFGGLVRRRGGSTTARPRTARVSVADRLGLVPPVWKRIAPLLGYVGIAAEVWRQVQAQLPEIRERVLSSRGTD